MPSAVGGQSSASARSAGFMGTGVGVPGSTGMNATWRATNVFAPARAPMRGNITGKWSAPYLPRAQGSRRGGEGGSRGSETRGPAEELLAERRMGRSPVHVAARAHVPGVPTRLPVLQSLHVGGDVQALEEVQGVVLEEGGHL